jgi:SAM-dependent methyltransferase
MKQWNEEFKKFGRIFISPQDEVVKINKLFKEKGIKRILDLGSGSGRHVVYFAKNGFETYGIDIAEEGINLTKEWLKENKLKADLKIGNIYDRLPYENSFFDAIISTQALHHGTIEKIRNAIKEIERVLSPNGYVFITFRKRKFRKFYINGTIIEKYGKQKTNYKVVAPRTYVPTDGGEKDLPHYLFNRELINKEFKDFKSRKIWVDPEGRHYCFLGQLKKTTP